MTEEHGYEVERLWYSPPRLEVPRGWLVYSLDFVLAAIQGCAADPLRVRRTRGWIFLGSLVCMGMAVVQAILMLLAWIPIISSLYETLARVFTRNTAGFFLRACYWKAKLRYLGQDTIIDQYVDIWGPRSISIGSRCHIDTNVRLAAGEQRHGQHGFIKIGSYVHLGPGVHIAGRGGVVVRDLVGISADAHIYSATNSIENPSDPGMLISMSHIAPHDQQHVVEGPVHIGEYAFVGMMARILPGVRVGRGAVVHANAHVTRSIPPFANYGGVASGRLIGWRRPRRLSSRLAGQIATLSETEELLPGVGRIRQVLDPGECSTLEAVMDLHFEAFAAGVTTQLGRSFVYRYYRAMVASDDSALWVAEQNGEVIGFLGVTKNRRRFESVNRSGQARLLAAWRLVTLRLSPGAVIRAYRKKHLSREYAVTAELLSIVVAPSARRLGLGRRFLDAWMKDLRAAGIPTFLVFTDNIEGLNFYQKYGGECLFKFRMGSLWSACFRFDVEQPTASG